MGQNLVSALPVIDRKNRCVGILSAADLVDLTRDTEEEIRELDLVDLSTPDCWWIKWPTVWVMKVCGPS